MGDHKALSDPQRFALTCAADGVYYYRADSFGHGTFAECSAAGVARTRVHYRTAEALEARGLVERDPRGDLSLLNGTVTILAYRITSAGLEAIGRTGELDAHADERDEDTATDAVPVADAHEVDEVDEHVSPVVLADVAVGMATPLGWVDYVSRHQDGGGVVYFLPFDRSAKTCRAYDPGARVELAECPHVPNILDASACAKCSAALAVAGAA
jgi:hypothetical protein